MKQTRTVRQSIVVSAVLLSVLVFSAAGSH